MSSASALAGLPARPDGAPAHVVHVVIETPRGSRAKLTFDPALGLFRLRKLLPAGAAFPHDFGFIPGTLGGDDDPLDVLLLGDHPGHPGVLVEARLVGVLEVEQRQGDGPARRNDRFLAVPVASPAHDAVRTPDDVGARTLDEIEHFFASYLALEDQRLRWLARTGPDGAAALVDEAAGRHARRSRAG